MRNGSTGSWPLRSPCAFHLLPTKSAGATLSARIKTSSSRLVIRRIAKALCDAEYTSGKEQRRYAARHRVRVVKRHRLHFGERRRDRPAERTIGWELLRDRRLRRGRRRRDVDPSAA